MVFQVTQMGMLTTHPLMRQVQPTFHLLSDLLVSAIHSCITSSSHVSHYSLSVIYKMQITLYYVQYNVGNEVGPQ